MKHQLDAKIIGDIVQFVAKRCHVNETAVRSAITTKCADENKMLRQRMERERNRSLNVLGESTIHSNKENIINQQ